MQQYIATVKTCFFDILTENDMRLVVIFTISRRFYYLFQRKKVLRREEIIEVLS